MSITLLDTAAIANVMRFGDTTCRQPDFIDPAFETAVWMGERGCVEVALSRLKDVPRLARNAYCPAGQPDPMSEGVRVWLDTERVAPTFQGWLKATILTEWVEFAEIVGAQTVEA